MEENNEFSYSNVLHYMEGVLYYKKEPLAIVKLVLQHEKRWVFVYEINSNEYKRTGNIRKDFEKVPLSSLTPVDPDSTIGADFRAKVLETTKNKYALKEKPYAYQVPIVGGVSSITGKEGDGYYERIRKRKKESKKSAGTEYEYVPSGVFISLDDVTWEHENYKMDADSLLKEGRRAFQAEQIANAGSQNSHNTAGVFF